MKKGFSYEEIEHEILDLGSDLFAKLAGSLLEEVPGDEEILKKVRQFGGKLAYRFVGYQEVTLRLGNGRSLKVRSPYFVKAKPKRGRKKRGPNGRGCHVLLELLGFMGHFNPNYGRPLRKNSGTNEFANNISSQAKLTESGRVRGDSCQFLFSESRWLQAE